MSTQIIDFTGLDFILSPNNSKDISGFLFEFNIKLRYDLELIITTYSYFGAGLYDGAGIGFCGFLISYFLITAIVLLLLLFYCCFMLDAFNLSFSSYSLAICLIYSFYCEANFFRKSSTSFLNFTCMSRSYFAARGLGCLSLYSLLMSIYAESVEVRFVGFVVIFSLSMFD